MEYSDNVEDGEIEEENESKGPQVESRFSNPQESSERVDNRDYHRGIEFRNTWPGEEIRVGHESKPQGVDQRYLTLHGGGHHSRPFAQPPPPARSAQTIPVGSSNCHTCPAPHLPSGEYRPLPMPVGMGRVEIGTCYSPAEHLTYAPPPLGFPRPPPTRPPALIPPAIAPAPRPVQPPVGSIQTTSHGAVDIKMKEAFSTSIEPSAMRVALPMQPPAGVTESRFFTQTQTEGTGGQFTTTTPIRPSSDNRYAAGMPMPSATEPPIFHHYTSAVSSVTSAASQVQKTTPRQVTPLINVVSDPKKAQVDVNSGEGTTVELSSPHHVPGPGASSTGNLHISSLPCSAIPAQSRPSPSTATAAPRPSSLDQTQPTSSIPASHGTTSLSHIMDAIGNGPIVSTRVHLSAAITSQRPLSPKSRLAADDGPLKSTYMARTLATTAPGVVQLGSVSVSNIAIGNASNYAAEADRAVRSFPETAFGAARRPRLAWGQGLRRRTSGPTDVDLDKGGDEAPGTGPGPAPSATVEKEAVASVASQHDLDRAPDMPNLTLARSQSEILSLTHSHCTDRSISIVKEDPGDGVGPDSAEMLVEEGTVEERDHDDDVGEGAMQEENTAGNAGAEANGNDDYSGNEKDNGEDADDRVDDNDRADGAGVDGGDLARVDAVTELDVVVAESVRVPPSATIKSAATTTARPKGKPGRPALSEEAKAQKKAERKAKKKAQAEKDVISGTRRKSSKGSYDPEEYDSGSDWDGEPGSKKTGRRGRPRTTRDSDAESGGECGEAPKKKRGRPPSGKTVAAASSAGGPTLPSAEEGVSVPPQRRTSKGRSRKGSKADDVARLAVPIKRRSRSFGSFERDSLGSIFTQMADWRNAYYALQGMVRIQVGMRGMHGFDREDLRGLSEMLQNPRSVVNLPIPYTSEIMMCLDIIEAQSHRRTDALIKLLLMKDELEEMPVRTEARQIANAVRAQGPTITAAADESADQAATGSEGSTEDRAVDLSLSSGVADTASVSGSFHTTGYMPPLKSDSDGSCCRGGFTVEGNDVPQNPITMMRKAFEKVDRGKRPISSFIPLPDPKVAVPILKANMKIAKIANIHAHIIPPAFSSKEDRAYIARQVNLNRADIKRNRTVIMEEIRRRKLNRSRAWEILGDRYVRVKHQWEHNLKHTAPTENEDEDLMAPRLRALSAMHQPFDDGVNSPRVARISALRAASDMCKNDVDQDKILQQLAMIELKQRRLKFGISTIVDMLSPWQNADTSMPPAAPTFPVKGMNVPDIEYMGSLAEKLDTSGFIKSEEFPPYVSDSPVIVDLNGSRLTIDGKRQMCSALIESKICPPGCNCAKQVDKLERQCRPWSDMEKCIFVDKFMQFPKNFSKIAAYLTNRTTKDCIKFYYDSKTTIPFKSLLREFDNRRKNLKISWTQTCAVATSVGGAVYPPEEVDEKEQLYELPVDDNSYNTLCSHPQYMASALGFESASPDEIGTYRRKQVKYMQALPPRHSTQLLNERRAWKKESAAVALKGGSQIPNPLYMGFSGGPGASRKFVYPAGGVYEVSSATSSVGATDTQYRGYAQSDGGWLERNRSMNKVRQRKPKESVDCGLFISSDLIGQERKVDILITGPASPGGSTGRGGRGKGRRGRRPNMPGKVGGRMGPREAWSGDGITITGDGAPGAHSGNGILSYSGRGRGRSRGTRGKGRGRGRPSHTAESAFSGIGFEQGEEEGGVVEGGEGEVLGAGTGYDGNEEFVGENEDDGEGDNADDEEEQDEVDGMYGEDVCNEMLEGRYVEEVVDNDSHDDDGDGRDNSSGDAVIGATSSVVPVKSVLSTNALGESEDVLSATDPGSGSDVTLADNGDPLGNVPVHLLPSEIDPLTESDITAAQLPQRTAFVIGPVSTTLLQSGTTLSINSAPLSGISLPPPDALPMSPGSLPVPTDATAILPFFPPQLEIGTRTLSTSQSTASDGNSLETKDSPRVPSEPINGGLELESCDDVTDRKRKSSNVISSRSIAADEYCGDEESRALKRVASGIAHP